MTEKVKRLYDAAQIDKYFHQEIEKADNDKVPTWYSTKQEKLLFATVYYGWLVGRYHENWEERVNEMLTNGY